MESWEAGDKYEPYVGRWSRVVAREFVSWLGVQPAARWLDVGCGTGALTETLLQQAEPSEVLAVDPSHGFIEFARARLDDPRAMFDVGDAMRLPFEPESFDAAVSGLVLNFVPDPKQAVSEMRRVVRGGGVVAAYVWDYAGEMQLIRYFWDAAAELDPAARELDEGKRFPICQPELLANLFSILSGVLVTGLTVPTIFPSFDDYWLPFLGGQGPAPAYAMSLDDERRDHLRETIRKRLPIARNGSISLKARAWAVKGQRPA